MAPASRGPRAVRAAELAAGARIVDLREGTPARAGARRVAFSELGAFAREAPAARVVVVDADEERAAAGAERLAALGLDAAWLVGGAAALDGARESA